MPTPDRTAPDANDPRPQHLAEDATPEVDLSDAGTSRVRPAGRRRPLVILVAVLLALALVVLGLHLANRSRHDDSHGAAATAAGSSATGTSSASSSTAASSTAASSTTSSGAAASGSAVATPAASASVSSAALVPGATRDQGGYVHTNYPASGHFAHSTNTIAARRTSGTVHTFIVEVETSLTRANAQLAANVVASQVAAVLNDPRGWSGMRSGSVQGVGFRLVNDPAKAQFVIHLATAQTVNRMCPLNTVDLWSCDAGSTVLLNADRWLYATPFYPSVTEYREYVVNHEVGHFLRFGHQYTCGAHGMAPTMMQQSKGLHGCRANPWPTVA